MPNFDKYKDILCMADHTLLNPTCTWNDIKNICDDGIMYHTASVCIPPCYVKKAKEYVGDKVKICTVIGFPNGYNTTDVKVFETENAVKNGADEIDMVVNQGMIKENDYKGVLAEINAVKKACDGRILKVIVETCNLNEQEKIHICNVVVESDADFIKTSTGFGSHGATKEDVALFKKYVDDKTKIKAAGGISSIKDAEDFIKLGADRLGTSRIVKCVKEEN